MSELNINELPFELLVMVFRFLDFVNLKKATRICKLWNNLIESECRWSLKLNFFYGYIPPLKLKHVLATNRKIGLIEILSRHFFDVKFNQMYQLFQRHGFNVVKLIVYDYRIESLNEFAELLKCTPNLKDAEIFYEYPSNTVSDLPLNYVFPELKKLKSLDISTSQDGVIRCFRKAKLTALTIWENSFSQQCDLLMEFLSSQEKLTSLTLKVERWATPLIEKWNVPIAFRLTSFVIKCNNRGDNLLSNNDNSSFLRFVKSLAESLTELEIGSCVPSSFYECVFANMAKLNSLYVRSCELTMDDDFYNRLKENRSVRTLKLWIPLVALEYQDLKFIGKFLKKLSNVRNLILTHCDKHTLKAAARNLPQLESLCIESLDSRDRSIVSVKFPHLKTLHIRHLKVRIKWSKFTKKHPRLTELAIDKIEWNSFLTSVDIERITSNVDLQQLRLGVGILTDKRFLEIIRTKGTNLTQVDVPLDEVGYYL